MAIRLADSTMGRLGRSVSVIKNLSEASNRGAKTAFLCHSHKDADLVRGLVNLLAEAGFNAYVDWTDASMPGNTQPRDRGKNSEEDTEI